MDEDSAANELVTDGAFSKTIAGYMLENPLESGDEGRLRGY